MKNWHLKVCLQVATFVRLTAGRQVRSTKNEFFGKDATRDFLLCMVNSLLFHLYIPITQNQYKRI